MRKLNLKNLTAALVVAVSFALPAAAQDASGPILFTNLNVFDGVNEALIENANVVVTDNLLNPDLIKTTLRMTLEQEWCWAATKTSP